MADSHNRQPEDVHRQVPSHERATTAHPGVSAQDQARLNLVTGSLRRILGKPIQRQIVGMAIALRGLNIDISPCTPIEVRTMRDGLVQRCELFLVIRPQEQLFYLRQLMASFRDEPSHHHYFRMAADILPDLDSFVRSIRTGQYNERRDGNWFAWWLEALDGIAQQNNISRQQQLQWDHNMVRHLIEYEIMGRTPVVIPNVLAPIANSHRTVRGTALPSITRHPRKNTGGSSGRPA
ncbi:uncharacterized protein GGS22DRAFT_186894 [Annulohypoxylon maeteangense]|uniref:uncharacterized protein n=1 Tax=Annulohypoxylon maeteangense TaxID=1927788 RepID=UPI002008A2B5|nr:uncharacterized protein GGS22DRAFT_186894 [Annulohypoxylon maeteangense]KAI0886822.1 hypothetical protein GGS22DRAFT_186894 [Annulohypoxylon maeteangense]